MNIGRPLTAKVQPSARVCKLTSRIPNVSRRLALRRSSAVTSSSAR